MEQFSKLRPLTHQCLLWRVICAKVTVGLFLVLELRAMMASKKEEVEEETQV